MQRRQFLPAIATLALASRPSFAQARPIRLVVPYPPGGPLDIVARALAERVKDSLGVVVVETRPGAGGNLGAARRPHSRDGRRRDACHQPLALREDALRRGARLHADHARRARAQRAGDERRHRGAAGHRQHRGPDRLRDKAPGQARRRLGRQRQRRPLGGGDVQGSRRTEAPAKLCREGASWAACAAQFHRRFAAAAQAGVYLVRIPYAGGSPAQLALIAGQVDLNFDNLAVASANIEAGKLKALAVTTARRSPALPEVPTIAESGGPALAGLDVDTWFGLFGPAGMPVETTQRLHRAFTAALASPELKARLATLLAEPAPMAPDQFAAFVAAESRKYERVVKASGAKLD